MNILNSKPPAVPFSLEDAQRAGDEWGFNCGPSALCAVLDIHPDAMRVHVERFGFAAKRYTNPTMMDEVLSLLNVPYRKTYRSDNPSGVPLIEHGLMRVQWGGPWTKAGVPMRVRYRHTHWVAVQGAWVFDVNAMCVGGWIPQGEWALQLCPWLIRECCPKGDGTFWPTHAIEVEATPAP